MSQPEPKRTFAVIQTPAGTNPYNLRSPFANFKSVMGEHWYEWLLPLTYSPCYKRREAVISTEAGAPHKNAYKLGPLVDEIKGEVGLLDGRSKEGKYRPAKESHRSHRSRGGERNERVTKHSNHHRHRRRKSQGGVHTVDESVS